MLSDLTPFGIYAGSAIGVKGNLTKTLSRDAALSLCEEKIGPAKALLPYGPEKISRIGIISGSASEPEILEEAAMNRIDLLITGEPKQPAYYLAREIGLNAGLRYVYTGNVPGDAGENTFCYRCGELVIERWGFQVGKMHIKKGRCTHCDTEIDGVWE